MKLIELEGVFTMDTGAPSPLLVSSDTDLMVLFYTDDEPYCCVLKFIRSMHHKFGMPGNETIHGHPYHPLGLESYGFFELEDSDYIKYLREISEVHERFNPVVWEGYKHFILTFHDTMFECIAADYEVHNIALDKYNQIIAAAKAIN